MSVYVTVANIGLRAGSDVIQLYVGDESSSIPRPVKELKAFAKVHLAAGETARVKLELTERDFAFYSVEAKHWLVEPGAFSLMVGVSAADIRLSAQIRRSNRVLIPV